MDIYVKIVLALGMFVFAAGCASEETLIEPPSESTLGEQIQEKSPALNQNVNSKDTASKVLISDTLTFSDALSKALLENPRLQSYGWQIRVKEAERLQAALPPNPSLSVEMENFGGTGPFEGYGARETSVRLSQKVLIGLDRLKAERVADLDKKLAGWDYETQRLEVLTGVTQSYVSALEAQRQLQLQKELVQIAKNLYETITAQIKAGKVSKLEESRAKVEWSRAQIDLENSRNRFEAALSNLASFWGSRQPQFTSLKGALASADSIPAYTRIENYINRNPDVARWVTEIQQQEALVSLERAQAIPDITISGGYKRMNDLDAGAAVAGITVPLPFFDRNQGSVKAARYELNRVRSQKEAAVAEARRTLGEAYNRLQANRHELKQLDEDVLPGAEAAFEAAQTAYRQGKFDYLDVLNAQRTLFSSRTRYIQALAEYNRSVAEVERLIGTSLSEVRSN